jgi:hypothetical protein
MIEGVHGATELRDLLSGYIDESQRLAQVIEEMNTPTTTTGATVQGHRISDLELKEVFERRRDRIVEQLAKKGVKVDAASGQITPRTIAATQYY